MGKKLPYTPNSRIRAALRKLWLRSRERAAALKRDKYTCKCGKKQCMAKGREVYVEVHHIDGIDWDGVIALIRERLLQTPDKLETMCVECHKEEGSGSVKKKQKGGYYNEQRKRSSEDQDRKDHEQQVFRQRGSGPEREV